MVRLCELMKAAILKKMAMGVAAVLKLAVLERAVAVRRYRLAMAARLCKLDVWAAAAGLRLGGYGWMAVRLGLVGFQLVVDVMQAEVVLEVEAGGVAQSGAGVAPPPHCPHQKTSNCCLSRVCCR